MAKILSSVVGNQITKQRVKAEFTFTINGTDFSSDLMNWNISNNKNFGSASANFVLGNQTGKFGEGGASKIEVGDVIQLTEKFEGDTEDWNRFYGVVEQRSITKAAGERAINITCLDYISTLQNLDIDLEVEGTKAEITDETLDPNYLPAPNDSLAQLFDMDNNSIAQDPAPILLIRDKNHSTDDPQYDGFEVLYDVGQVKLGSPLNALYNYDLIARSYWFYTSGVFVEDILETILTQVDGYGKYLFGEDSAAAVITNHLTETFYNVEGSGLPDYMVPNYTVSTIEIRHQVTSAVTAGDTSIQLDSTDGLPTSGTGTINGDTFTWSSLGSANTLEGVSGVLAHPENSYFKYEKEYDAGQVWYLSYSNLTTDLTISDFNFPSSSTIDYIDKRYGRIILDSAISTSTIATCTSDYTFKTLQATGIELNKISFRAREIPNRYEAINKLRQYIAPNYIIRTIGNNKIWSSYLTQKVNHDYTVNLVQNANYLEDEDLYTRVKMWGKNDNPTNLLFGDSIDFVTTGETYKALATQTELVKTGDSGNYWVYGNLLSDAGYINLDTIVPKLYINGIPVDNTSHQLAQMPVVIDVTTRTETRSGCHGISKEQYVKQHTYYYYKVRFAHTNIEPSQPIYLYNAFGVLVKTISPGDGNMDYGRGVWHAPGSEQNSTLESISTASYSVFYSTASIDIDYDNVRFKINKQILPNPDASTVTATFEYWTVMTPVEDIASIVDGRWDTQVQTEFFSEPPSGYNYAIVDMGSVQTVQALDIVAGFYKPDEIRKFDIDMRLTLHYSTDGTTYRNISDATKNFSMAGGESVSFEEDDLGIGFQARYIKIILENVKKISFGDGVWVVAFTEISAYGDVVLSSNATLIPCATLESSVSPSDTEITVDSTAYFTNPGADVFDFSGDITISVTPTSTYSETNIITYSGDLDLVFTILSATEFTAAPPQEFTYTGTLSFSVTPTSSYQQEGIYSYAGTTSFSVTPTSTTAYEEVFTYAGDLDAVFTILSSTTYTPAPSGGTEFTYSGALTITFTIASTYETTTPITVTFQEGVDSYTGTTDTQLYKSGADTNYGTTTTLKVCNQFGSGVFSSLIKFDVSSIPATATITSATLTLTMDSTNFHGGTWGFYRCFKPWVESTATWNDWDGPNSEWGTAGCDNTNDSGVDNSGDGTGDDRTATAFDTSSANTSTIDIDFATPVQNWVDGSWDNNGVAIDCIGTISDGADFRSSEHATTSQRPKLVVVYETAATEFTYSGDITVTFTIASSIDVDNIYSGDLSMSVTPASTTSFEEVWEYTGTLSFSVTPSSSTVLEAGGTEFTYSGDLDVALTPSSTYHFAQGLFYDTFTESTNTELSLHAPDTGFGYEKVRGVVGGSPDLGSGSDLTVSGASDTLSGLSSPASFSDGAIYKILIDSGESLPADASISADIPDSPPGADDLMHLCLRVQDIDNMYILTFNQDSSQMYKLVSNTLTAIGSAGGSVVDDDHVEFRIVGNTLSFYINGNLEQSTTDSSITAAGTPGIGMGELESGTSDVASCQFDHLRVQTVGTPDTIAFDTSGTGTGTSMSFSIGSGANRMLVVGIGSETAGDIDDVTYDGVSMTKVAEVDPESAGTCAMFYMLEADLPSSGSHTVSVTYGSASDPANKLIGCMSLENVKQEAPEASETHTIGSGQTISKAITTLTDNAWVVSVVFSGDTGSYTAQGTGQTERFDFNTGATAKLAGSANVVASAGSYTVQWLDSDSNPFRQGLVAISVAPNGS